MKKSFCFYVIRVGKLPGDDAYLLSEDDSEQRVMVFLGKNVASTYCVKNGNPRNWYVVPINGQVNM